MPLILDGNELKKYIFYLEGHKKDYETIINYINNAKLVLIGESTHGTNEFYKIRTEITRELIKNKGVRAIAIEGDWPDTYRINRYIKGDTTIKSPLDSLKGFKRFPTWMWRNKITLEFIEWLYEYNKKQTISDKIGFYGLDIYSLHTSIEIVVQYLEKADPDAANRVKDRYSCFDNVKDELPNYGLFCNLGIIESCEEKVIEQLKDLNKNSDIYLNENKLTDEEMFNLQQNALTVKNAEDYYRSMFSTRSSWNIRDIHMFITLENIYKHLTKYNRNIKIVVWAHNSHIGDARATEMGMEKSELNLGQLVRQKYNDKAFLLGFLTDSGYVTAASNWDEIAERKIIRPSIPGSYEYYFHNIEPTNYFINLHNQGSLSSFIPNELLERAIGVIYRPKTERVSHYFYANLLKQFDALIYLDKTSALEPLETTAIWHKGEVDETFPTGL
jgi:erythromycin esterase-like protein